MRVVFDAVLIKFSTRSHSFVTYDKDLLALKKPFGIEIVSPAQFLKLVTG